VSDPDRTADHPATFREVLASGEYRALYAASVLSWFGDYLARAAVTAMVFRQTGSVTASAATFAISYLPWLGIGPVLTALAERYRYRSVMVGCDLARMALMGLVALPSVPIPAMMLLLFATSLLNPPFDASRSALLPRILDGDRYVLGLALNSSSFQFAQIVGYLAGGTLGAVNPRLAIALNAALTCYARQPPASGSSSATRSCGPSRSSSSSRCPSLWSRRGWPRPGQRSSPNPNAPVAGSRA
jgi:Major Facilitator Superfamily